MTRFANIVSARFDQVELPLPMSARIGRRSQPLPATGDDDGFIRSVQLAPAVLTGEVTLRGIAAAEGLTLGQSGELSLTLGTTQAGQSSRTVRLRGAVLYDIELTYTQQGMAQATLKFAAQAADNNEPFEANDETNNGD